MKEGGSEGEEEMRKRKATNLSAIFVFLFSDFLGVPIEI